MGLSWMFKSLLDVFIELTIFLFATFALIGLKLAIILVYYLMFVLHIAFIIDEWGQEFVNCVLAIVYGGVILILVIIFRMFSRENWNPDFNGFGAKRSMENIFKVSVVSLILTVVVMIGWFVIS